MKTAIVILHYGALETTLNTLKSLEKKLTKTSYHLILINNTSLSLPLKNTSTLTILNPKTNLGFAKGVNLGITHAFKTLNPDSIMLLNNDAEFLFGNLNILNNTLFSDKSLGVVSPVLFHSANQYDWGAKLNKLTGNIKHTNFPQKPKTIISPQIVSAAAVLIKKEVIETVGLFDERFFLYFEDVDFFLRVHQEGYKIAINPQVVVQHTISSSSSPIFRLYHQWKSHFKLSKKYLFRKIYPTAFIYNLTFYPLAMLKTLLFKK